MGLRWRLGTYFQGVPSLLVDLGSTFDAPTIIKIDSKSAVDMSVDPVAFKNTKHILRAAEFLRDVVLKESAVLEHCAGRFMIADLLTKNVSRPIFIELMRMLAAYPQKGLAGLDSAPAASTCRCWVCVCLRG